MADTSSYVASSATIPPWPSSCVDCSNVFTDCESMQRAWSEDVNTLMPERITNHSDAVKGAGRSLTDLFDVTWGGTSNKFYIVNFLKPNGQLFATSGDWTNSRRVMHGENAVPPTDGALINQLDDADKEKEAGDNDYWFCRWFPASTAVTANISPKRTYTRITKDIYFYDLYKSATIPIKSYHGATAIPTHERVYFPSDISAVADSIISIGWTTSPSESPESSGDIITLSTDDGGKSYYLPDVTENASYYWHYEIKSWFDVTFIYRRGNDEEVRSVEQVGYGKNCTSIPDSLLTNDYNGHSFHCWKLGEKETTIDEILNTPVYSNITYEAHYEKNTYTINFIGGYDGVVMNNAYVKYQENLPDEKFPTKLGNQFSFINYTGWDKSDTSKYTNVTKSAEISSNYIRFDVTSDDETPIEEPEITIFSYSSKAKLYGSLTSIRSGEVAVSLISYEMNEEEKETVGITGISNVEINGNTFSCDVERSIKPVETVSFESFRIIVKDTEGRYYSRPVKITVLNNLITIYANDNSWYNLDYRPGKTEDENHDANGNRDVYFTAPNSTDYHGVIETVRGYNVLNSWSKCRVSFTGYENLSFYIRYCGMSATETTVNDFIAISKLNHKISEKPTANSDDLECVVTMSSQVMDDDGGTVEWSIDPSIENYNRVDYTNLNSRETYTVDIMYVKNGTHNVGIDRGYFLIGCPQSSYSTYGFRWVEYNNVALTD